MVAAGIGERCMVQQHDARTGPFHFVGDVA